MEMRQDTKIALAWELLEAGVPKGHIAKRSEISRRTVIRWAQGFQGAGSLTAFSCWRSRRRLPATIRISEMEEDKRDPHRHCEERC